MIQPTVGRVVWFRALGHISDQPQAAIVTFVHSDGLVNLAVFDPNGERSGHTSVPLYQGEGDRPAGDYCEWMPYQIGQAAKHAEPARSEPRQVAPE
jgi:hypothetical protein